jgi:hypothetical protein
MTGDALAAVEIAVPVSGWPARIELEEKTHV